MSGKRRKRHSAEDIIRGLMGPDDASPKPEPAVEAAVASATEGVSAETVQEASGVAFAGASGAASGAHRLLDMISCGFPPGSQEVAVTRARRLLIVALIQLDTGEKLRAKAAAAS